MTSGAVVQLADLLSQLDPRSRVRGHQFERLCAWYLRNAPEYRDRIRNVWMWSDWPGAWAADAGIDLVAEDHDGGLWAIQAKAYASSYAIKKADIDSFLSESSRAQFSFRVLIATTDHLGPTARRTLEGQREPVTYVLRSQLELAQVAWPSSFGDLRSRRPSRKNPFPHVQEAIEATLQGFAHEPRGQLIMACGTGKTLAAMWIAERLGCERTLVLVPSLSLLAQTLREWCANASEPFEYLAVCSDPTVVGEDQFVEHTTELGFPTTTNSSAIAAFVRRSGRRVVFATYQSSHQIAEASHDGGPPFDLAVADEAHRCAGRTSTEFATILDETKIRSRRRLFMTATPRFYTPRVRTEAGQLGVEVASMDNNTVFGPVLHRLSFGEAIGRKLLSDYQVVVVAVDDDMYRAWAERGEFVTTDGETLTDARSLAGQIGLGKTMRKYELRRVISFHGRVKAAREFSAEMPHVINWMPPHIRPVGVIWSEHVSGEMTSGHRDRLLLRFKELAPEEHGLLSNARCLGEGVDVPSIDAIAFIDPRRSTIDIVQALGRALRKSADKRLGTIVLPVFLSEDEDADQALNASAFRDVWDVLKALRAHDETLGEELDELRRRGGARRGAAGRPGKIKLDVPKRIGADFERAFDARLVERTTSSLEFWLGLLTRYAEENGTVATLRGRHVLEGTEVGAWLRAQRASYARGALSSHRATRLEALPGWVWVKHDTRWDLMFGLLGQYIAREGKAAINERHVEGGERLGKWVSHQQAVYQGTRAREKLTSERIARLEALPGWSWERQSTTWDRGFQALDVFARREGHTRVPRKHVEGGVNLESWVKRQRTDYDSGRLQRQGEDRVARLETLPGWRWRTAYPALWERGYVALLRFRDREGHLEVPHGHVEDGVRLESWILSQRTRYQSGALAADMPECVERLDAVPGWKW